jgi:hypothetical protein
MDQETQNTLQEILRRESRSVLTYVAEAFPWGNARQVPALLHLQELIARARDAIARLGQLLVRRRVELPFLGSYPSSFTTINFLSFDYLIPRLIDAERRAIVELEYDLKKLHDAEARTHIEEYLTLKRRHLVELEGLASPQPEPATVS